MEQDPELPLTAGEWAERTRTERTLGAFFLLTFGLCGLSGGLGAMAVFKLGELTGHPLTDMLMLGFVGLGSFFALFQGAYLIDDPACRSCGAALKPSQFRCGQCAALVDGKARA